MKITEILDVHVPREWRAWLKKNRARSKEIWLVYYKKGSGEERVSYNDAVDEALCFGWIDSTVKTLDARRYCQRFSPRKQRSPWSELNKHRVRRLIKEGRMAPAGLAAFKGNSLPGGPLKVPADILRALRKDKTTWKHFQAFPKAYRRIRIGWIEAARWRPAVFKQRLAYFLRSTALNKRFGMLQG